jgi:hypothetical protein
MPDPQITDEAGVIVLVGVTTVCGPSRTLAAPMQCRSSCRASEAVPLLTNNEYQLTEAERVRH